MRHVVVLFSLLIITITAAFSQNAEPYRLRVAFWNLENLFDTINAPAVNDNEFTPTGRYKWNTEKYLKKTVLIRQVITEINPAVMGLCEVENAEVIEDILPEGFRYIHYDSRDTRGIDVALIYNPTKIRIIASEPIRAYGKLPTRDLLRVDAQIIDNKTTDKTSTQNDRTIAFIVTHLPSRRGNDPQASAQRRDIGRQLDSISTTGRQMVIMGDFNQNPSKELLPKLYNTTSKIYNKGKGSYAYRDVWQMYDQILVSNSLLTNAVIYTKGLIQQSGRFGGYPAKGNPSDHLPVYIDIE